MTPSPTALASLLEPALPDSDGLGTLAAEVVSAIARLDGRIAGGLAHVIPPLFRAAHTHHSLYIEDRPSTLKELASAVSSASRTKTRDREADLRASLDVLAWLHEGDGRALAERTPADVAFVRSLHERFYAAFPAAARRLRVADSGREVDVAPGALRSERATVGTHDAPDSDTIAVLLDIWSRRFAPDSTMSLADRLLLAVSSHHRLLYIHPFRDGNGRVARFALDAYLIALGLDAKGAWTPARGFARARTAYYAALGAADDERRSATDGRGSRSADGLARWCRFVLEVFRDQAEFVTALLEPAALSERLRAAVTASLRSTPAAAEKAVRLVRCAWSIGPITRGDIARDAGVPDRTARRLLIELATIGWIAEAASPDSREAPVVGAVPLLHAPTVFPNLFLPE
ncbi:MAG TPA: Fic family protein [Gemmatimonadaceae bacterium]|nr:Fic family protein [Gemmatimonadaceae bacterium]